ncbi:(2Fe-2S)-binding protein [Tropicimonas sp. IMCC34043]|uniref:(2Fe-2S)-binding protein n=1 Tax=Tropicimonas sp. IMCC34043 TaxID=2248760 RepID=UPI000E27A685|nr:(2Fe-2S)-binding protein [Tropicimonas sp. IMCC34043]
MSEDRTIGVILDGVPSRCAEGLPLTSLLAARAPGWRASPRAGAPRGMFCGMGLCFECMVEVDGRPARACLETAREGMKIRTATGPGAGS